MALIHPMVVHFPIALILLGVVCDLVRAQGGERLRSLSTLGLWCTTLGVAMILPAIGSGFLAHSYQPTPNPTAEWVMSVHEKLSYAELLLFSSLVIWRWDARGDDGSVMPRGYLALGVVGALLVVASGHLGGRLVYEHGMGVDGALREPVSSEAATVVP